ncbi:MAG: heparinase II/III family protein [Planctomycetaceae bacterium]|nr:heparinase II/III family protein [Planctomycetaceae bacterium]
MDGITEATKSLKAHAANVAEDAGIHPVFFSWLDLERKGLEGVKEKVQQKKYAQAAEALLVYFRNRTGSHYYDGWDRRTLRPDYDTRIADAICRNHLVGQDMGEDINWKADPHGDPEWKYCLNRHEFLTELGRAYWYTGKECYTQAYKRILTDWIAKNPMPDLEWMLNVPSETSRKHFMKLGTWRPLTLGIRLYTAFVPCFHHFVDSPEFTPEFMVTMLTSMVEHAWHLRWYYTRHKSYFNVSPNWGIMESNGLAHMGILFPEFKEATDWQHEAISRLEEQVRMQVLPDGAHVERASGYHLVCTFCFLQILDLAQRNGVRISDTYRKQTEKMVEFVLNLMKPHGYFPMLKDGDESDVHGEKASYGLWEDINNLNMIEDGNDLRWVFKAAARLFDRPDMLYAATSGKQGRRPAVCSVAMPEGGFYAMRTGWEKDDLYMVYTCGELGVKDQNCVHGHADALSIDVSGFGETLLIDPGRNIYEGPYRIWFKGTSAHNTVAVDGKDSSELADEWMFKTKADSKVDCWSSTDKFDYVDGRHNGYERLADPVTHRRRVCFVKPHFWLVIDDLIAADSHSYSQYFHFGPQAKLQSDPDLSVTAVYPNGAGIVVRPLQKDSLAFKEYNGSKEPIQGWVSYDYAVKVPAPVIEYSVRKRGPVRLVTLLVPFKEKPVDCSIESGGKDVYKIGFGQTEYQILLPDGTDKKVGNFEFDGQMLCTAFGAGGKLIDCFAAGASRISYMGEVLLDSVIRHKVNFAGKSSR